MGATLTKYAVDLRYPNEIVIEEHDVAKALKDSEYIVNWAKEVLAAPSVEKEDGNDCSDDAGKDDEE